MARDKKRIKKVLNLIETYWDKNSDQRFGQMLINLGIAKDELLLWNLDDDELEQGLNKVLKDDKA